MYLFCRTFAGRLASTIGAFLFAFSALRLAQFGHTHLSPPFFLPLAARCLLHYERKGVGGYLLGCALFLALQFYCGIYLGMVAVLVLLPYGAIKCFHRHSRPRFLRHVAAAVILTILLVLPLALPYLQTKGARGFSRDLIEAHIYGAHITHFLAAHPSNVWHSITAPILRAQTAITEKYLMLGVGAFFLAFLGLRQLYRMPSKEGAFLLLGGVIDDSLSHLDGPRPPGQTL